MSAANPKLGGAGSTSSPAPDQPDVSADPQLPLATDGGVGQEASESARSALRVIEPLSALGDPDRRDGDGYALRDGQLPRPKAQPNSLETLLKLVHIYSPKADLEPLRKTYTFAEMAHESQSRGTGEPYISHPLAVAIMLAEMRLDVETLQAALLHDTIEDTAATYEDIAALFGVTVARLVEGVTKLGSIPKLRPLTDGAAEKSEKYTRDSQQAENLRKMFLAMFDDPRVVLIKLADRLHNMRTLQGIPPDKQERVAAQTIEIYAPLANRLGMWQMKGELEDLSFSYLNPTEYNELTSMLSETKVARDRYLKRVIATLQKTLSENNIEVSIKGRVKHAYSLWQKMQRKHRGVEQIYDVLAVRVIVESKADCYAALGIIHSLWPPIPGEFDDYISRPKESMYQSLHTAVWALDNKPLEIQIRTAEMHELAEFGIAAHWRYKEQRGGKRDLQYEEKIAWLRRLMSWRDEVESAQDFVDSLKSDLFQEHIYVFTPQGDIVELPKGATPIDFAFRIHTSLGYQCAGAKVNDKLVPLDTPLQNGAVVRIMKDKNRPGPSRDWLQSERFMKTAAARQKVRQYFRKQRRDENISEGRDILDQTLKHLGLNHVSHSDVLGYFPHYRSLDDFMEAIGNTDVSPQQITQKLGEHRQEELLLPEDDASHSVPTALTALPNTSSTMQVSDLGGILTTLGRCCKPMPGDEIIGYTTKGRGITVHRADCPNLVSVSDTGRLVRVSWSGGKTSSRYPAGVRVEALDRVGLLRDVTTMLADEKVNLVSIHTHKKPSSATSTLIMTLEVTGVEQLYGLMDRLSSVRGVYKVQRDTGGVLDA